MCRIEQGFSYVVAANIYLLQNFCGSSILKGCIIVQPRIDSMQI